MNIDSMKVAIRPMSTPQALDLGMAMARHWFVPLWKIWMGMALPIYLLFYLGGVIVGLLFDVSVEVSLSTLGTYGGLIFWWLKPLYEKPMMAWLGDALFIEPPTIKNTIKAGWRDTKSYGFTLLVKRRLSLKRQLMLPILMLEKPDKTQFKERLQVLSRGQGGGIGWHTILMVHIEVIISAAALLLLWQLLPTGLVKAPTLFMILEYAPLWAEMVWGALFFLAVSIVAPFFVAGGFALYLTKRCLLEGWDVELVFKDLRQRYNDGQANPLTQLASSTTASAIDNSQLAKQSNQSAHPESGHLPPFNTQPVSHNNMPDNNTSRNHMARNNTGPQS